MAIAGPLAAVYPTASPGGWRLIGRTSVRLWDTGREPPAVFSPGLRVTFRPVSELPAADSPGGRTGGRRISAGSGFRSATVAAGPVVEVIRPGPLATVQDLGRPGYGHLGVSRSGAADPGSLVRANELVGNPPGAAGIELTLGRGAFRFPAGAVVAVAGRGGAADRDRRPGQPGQAAGFGRALTLPGGRGAAGGRAGRPGCARTWRCAGAWPGPPSWAAGRRICWRASGRRRCGRATCCRWPLPILDEARRRLPVRPGPAMRGRTAR